MTAGAEQRVAFVLHGFSGGGIERSMLRLGEAFLARGLAVDFVVGEAKGELLNDVPGNAQIVELGKVRVPRARMYGLAADLQAWKFLLQPRSRMGMLKPLTRQLPLLAKYLREAKPNAVLSAQAQYNLMTVWGRRLDGSRARVVITEHITVSRDASSGGPWGDRRLLRLLRRAYLKADAIVTVSDGVGDDLAAYAGIPRELITTVYNPVVGQDLPAKAQAPLDHPWFASGEPPVILAAGRLDPQKDFATLIRAFARLRSQRPARLVILGAANPMNPSYADELRALSVRLGIADDVSLAGFHGNPFAYMSRAAVFALSSAYEGLGNVLIEALACGTPVVSTDCPNGPREILDHGRFGQLVPVGDDAALASAILSTLEASPDPGRLQERAATFSIERAVNRYLDMLLVSERRGRASIRSIGTSCRYGREASRPPG
jgi:glycosyltransferase involved in cell wall biosynthesis